MERTTEEFKMLFFDLMNGTLDLTNDPQRRADIYMMSTQIIKYASKRIQRFWRLTGMCESG